MNVKQLIAKLEKLDPSTRVLVDGHEGDYDNPTIGKPIKVRDKKPFRKGSPSTDEGWYYGRFASDEKGRINAIVIGRGE